MTRTLSIAAVAALALLALLAEAEPARAQSSIRTDRGMCLGLKSDGQTVVTKRCDSREVLTATVDGNVLRATAPSGAQGCLDGYRGHGGNLELVACDGTPEQTWYVHGEGWLQNIATQQCVDIRGGATGSGAGIINWDCNHAWNQKFAFGAAPAPAVAAAAPAPVYQAPAPVAGVQ